MSVIDAKKRSLVSPSSTLLDMHLEELEEECTRFLSLIAALRSLAECESPNEDERDTIEGELYASLSHLHNHAQPAMDEVDRLIDEMPDDDEDLEAD
jgi:hypothetical protein